MNHPIAPLGRSRNRGQSGSWYRTRSPEPAESGPSRQERVDDGDGGEEDDEESGISLTFTVCQALC